MSARGGLIGLVAVAIVVVAVVLIARRGAGGKKAPNPTTRATSPTPTTPRTEAPTPSSRPPKRGERPTLKLTPAPALRPSTSMAARFDAETRNEAWATQHEALVRKRVESLQPTPTTIEIGTVECRRKQCRVPITGPDPAAFQRYIERLQGPDGFYKRATRFMLADYTSGEPSSVTVYLHYE